MSSDNRDMWTPLERAVAPFKGLARLNRRSILADDGQQHQVLLDADRCRVLPPGEPGADVEFVELGFSLDAEVYSVTIRAADYYDAGVWNLEQLRTDLSAALRSGALTPHVLHALSGA
jgi:hypothetical protein